MLTATSIGITARVLRDLGYLNDRVAQIILGAAIIDDVLALLTLGIVDGAIEATSLGTSLLVTDYVIIAVKAIGFLIGAIVIGQYLAPRIFQSVKHFESRSVVIGISISFCFLTSFIASQVGLAAIIGAFAAGLILEEIHFEDFDDKHTYNLEHFLAPVSALLAPIFFISIGLKVDLRAFAEPSLLYFAICLTAVAVFGKLVCALGVREHGVNKWAVGFGMIPRGEVILFFASYGTSLMLTDLTGTKNPVIEPSTFSAVVICVMISTLITPPLLNHTLGKKVEE
jgi:Kef-type K+ transport system membrane component KefB